MNMAVDDVILANDVDADDTSAADVVANDIVISHPHSSPATAAMAAAGPGLGHAGVPLAGNIAGFPGHAHAGVPLPPGHAHDGAPPPLAGGMAGFPGFFAGGHGIGGFAAVAGQPHIPGMDDCRPHRCTEHTMTPVVIDVV